MRPDAALLERYCEALQSIQLARSELMALKLDNCKIIRDSLESLEREGEERLCLLFSELLQSCSEPIDLMLIKQSGTAIELPNETILNKLSLIVNQLSNTERLARLFVDVRGKYLALCIQSLLSLTVASQASYQRGSHPVIIGLRLVRDALAPIERQLCDQVLPTVPSLFERTLKPATTILQGYLSLVGRESLAACEGERHLFLECIFLLDILEEVYRTSQHSADLANCLQVCFSSLLDVCKQWFDGLDAVIGRHQFKRPQNASIYEGTVIAMNCICKLADYDTIAEAVLANAEDTRSARSNTSSASFLNPDSVMAVSFYITELCKLAEDNFEATSKLYARSLESNVFLLNNYNFMIQTIKSNDKLSVLVPVGMEARLENQIKGVVDTLDESWNRLARCLLDNKESPKDAYKAFCNDLIDQLTIGAQITLPDHDYRLLLRTKMQRAIMPPVNSFREQHKSLFVSSGFTKLDPDTVAAMISKLFEG